MTTQIQRLFNAYVQASLKTNPIIKESSGTYFKATSQDEKESISASLSIATKTITIENSYEVDSNFIPYTKKEKMVIDVTNITEQESTELEAFIQEIAA